MMKSKRYYKKFASDKISFDTSSNSPGAGNIATAHYIDG